MKQIPLTQGKFALVDDEDFDRVNQYKWRYDNGYAVRTTHGSHKMRKKISMHHFIMNTLECIETDHRDLNRSNNQKYNLRTCTTSQNQANRKLLPTNTSGFKGVKIRKEGYIQGYIRVRGKLIYTGSFKNVIDAATAYNEVAKKYFGEFAQLNIIPE